MIELHSAGARRDAAAPAAAPSRRPRLSERHVLQLAVLLAAGFVAAAVVAALIGGGGAGRWSAIHLALAGAATTAIGAFMPHFAVTMAGTRPEPALARLATLVLLAAGGALAALGLPAGWTAATLAGLSLLLLGVAGTAWMTFAPLRNGLARRHPIAQVAYGAALLQLSVGLLLALLFLAGWEPVTEAWLRLKPAHAWLNLVGFVSLTIAATLVYLFPTVLGARIRAHPSLVLMLGGLLPGPPLAALGSALGAPGLALAGAALTAVGAAGQLWFAADAWRRRGTFRTELAWHRLSAAHLGAAMAWFAVATVALALQTAIWNPEAGWSVGALALPLVGGWVLQALAGSWGHLFPVVAPGDPGLRPRQRALLSRWPFARVAAWNAGVAAAWIGAASGEAAVLALGAALLAGAIGTAIVLLAASVRVTAGGRSAVA